MLMTPKCFFAAAACRVAQITLMIRSNTAWAAQVPGVAHPAHFAAAARAMAAALGALEIGLKAP